MRKLALLLGLGFMALPHSAGASFEPLTEPMPQVDPATIDPRFKAATLTYQCSAGENPALEMHITLESMAENNFQLTLRGNSLDAIKNGARIEIEPTRPQRGELLLCLTGGSCEAMQGQLLVVDFVMPNTLQGVMTWRFDKSLPPVVSPFYAQLPLGFNIPTCSPPAPPQ